jgi:hypothetical protein
VKAKIDKLKKKFGVGKGEESHPKEKVVSEDCGFSQTTFEFFNKDNKRIGVLNTSEKEKKEQFADIKAFLDVIVLDKKLDDINSYVIIKITNEFPLLNEDEIDSIIYKGTAKDFKL